MKRVHDNVASDVRAAILERRDRLDLLRCRASLLKGRDKLLMTMFLENGNSFRQIASLAGVSESCIAKRIHKITKRLLDGGYVTCLHNREKFSVGEMAMAKDYFLHGLSMHKIGEKHKCTFYQIRKTMMKVRALVRVLDTSS